MTPFLTLVVAAAAALVIGTAIPAAAASLELAQGKSNKVMSGEKGSDKARDAMERKDERVTGRDNAAERGEGQKKGLTKQMESDTKGKKPGK
jgi:Sec-independent protein translocase protein TatA